MVFGKHNFVHGGFGILPGVVGTERSGLKGYFGFSDVSSGWTGIGNDRHVDGYVKTYSTNGFVFPIGDNGKYRPAAVTGASESSAAYYKADPGLAVTSDLFSGTYLPLPAGAPFNRTLKSPYIDEISDLEYWDIDGDVPTKITLTWDLFSEIDRLTNFNIQKLSIVGWNGEKWVEIPSTIDILYLEKNKSTPSFFGGVSSLMVGSITTNEEIIPNDYDVYTLASLAVAIVGDYVWEDLDRNGLQDLDEPGIPNVTVELLDNSGEVFQSTVTDENGNYYFTFVPFGNYSLRFVSPEDYQITLPKQGDPQFDSDLNFSGKTTSFFLEGIETELSLDAGFYRTSEVGDFVWLDDNQDGIQQEEELGVEGVRVELLDKNQNILASTVTNSNGNYKFTNLPPGTYYVRFVPPPSYQLSPYHSVLDRTLDSDANPQTGLTDPLSLISGLVNNDIDAGLSAPCNYVAAANYGPSYCGGAVGFIETAVTGTSGPYTYLWSTGDTTANLYNLVAGEYTLIVSDSEGCNTTFIVEILNAIPCAPICVDLDLSVLLEGTYDHSSGEMYTRLNELGYLPGQRPVTFFGKYTEAGQPYNREPYYYQGTDGYNFESANTSENNEYYPEETVDWVLVSLRSKEQNEYEACTRAGLLMKNGTIIFMNDECCLVDPSKDYYVVVEHRNHLLVMSHQKVEIIDSTIQYDFRAQQSYTRLFGYGQKEVEPGKYVMYAGNGDQYLEEESPVDINVSDLTEWLKENGKHSSYYFMDFDLNGDANVQDKSYYLENIGIFSDVPKN